MHTMVVCLASACHSTVPADCVPSLRPASKHSASQRLTRVRPLHRRTTSLRLRLALRLSLRLSLAQGQAQCQSLSSLRLSLRQQTQRQTQRLSLSSLRLRLSQLRLSLSSLRLSLRQQTQQQAQRLSMSSLRLSLRLSQLRLSLSSVRLSLRQQTQRQALRLSLRLRLSLSSLRLSLRSPAVPEAPWRSVCVHAVWQHKAACVCRHRQAPTSAQTAKLFPRRHGDMQGLDVFVPHMPPLHRRISQA